ARQTVQERVNYDSSEMTREQDQGLSRGSAGRPKHRKLYSCPRWPLIGCHGAGSEPLPLAFGSKRSSSSSAFWASIFESLSRKAFSAGVIRSQKSLITFAIFSCCEGSFCACTCTMSSC